MDLCANLANLPVKTRPQFYGRFCSSNLIAAAGLWIMYDGRLLQDQPKIKHFIANALTFASLR
jgi:hypothetical protein